MTLGLEVKRRDVLKGAAALGVLSSVHGITRAQAASAVTGNDRQYWVNALTKVSGPVLHALSERKLKATMPVEAPHGNVQERAQFTYLEALGRLLTGIAPWLESGSEERSRAQYTELSRAAIAAATDPRSPDFMNFNKGAQPVVDAAFLALAILRAPTELWQKLDKPTQENLARALESTRVIKPGYNNWLLFSAMIETALAFMGRWWDPMRVDYAVRAMDSFYKGDGVYGDGTHFHWDYYNSFVIHPFLLHVLESIGKVSSDWTSFWPNAMARAQRYAEIQERMIAPDGTFPPIGRSLPYRFGAFHLLAEMSLRKQLPETVTPTQVRCALTAVMRKMMEGPGTFDEHGWLQIGFCGHQPEIAESYISTGSSYLCSAAWLPLGLPETDAFWSGAAEKWTSQKAWSGLDVKADHAISV